MLHLRHFGHHGTAREPGRPTRCAAVLVEFAICVPVALLITFGMIDLARANMLRNTAENAAYEGARAGITPGATAAKSSAAAALVMDAIAAQQTTISVSPAVLNDDTEQVTVTVSVPIAPNLWASKIFFGTRQISRSCTLSREATRGI